MIGKFGLFILVAIATSSVAFAGTVKGTLQEDFTCPAGNCTTVCVGPGGQQSISSYKELSAWMIGQPDRLWLMMDNSKVIVLGVGDRCTFAGTPYTIGQPTEVDPLPPVPPQCTCIGGVCTPPECKH
jgi:hypothetical protein